MHKRIWYIAGVLVAAAVLTAAALVIRQYTARHRYVFVANDVQVTIPEGTNIADLERLVVQAGIVEQGSLLTAENIPLEGMLFPDTYRFDRASFPEVIIETMRSNFKKRTQDITGMPDKRMLIIASILEKEVRTSQDMRMVAGIIEKRLKPGMTLQLDATVAYGVCYLKFLKGVYCDVSQANIVDNIRRDSAYNTYMRTGLPAGPISNPGRAAMDAALHPQTSDFWYYLSSKDGTTIFSKTLEEHNRAKAKYLR